jgi:hypothetical protein
LKNLFRNVKPNPWKIVEKGVVRKINLRHSNLATTQRYLGEIRVIEAMRWIDRLHG